jgi:hypothetical protein
MTDSTEPMDVIQNLLIMIYRSVNVIDELMEYIEDGCHGDIHILNALALRDELNRIVVRRPDAKAGNHMEALYAKLEAAAPQEPMSEAKGVEAGRDIERAAIAAWFRHTAMCIRKDADEGLWYPLDENDVQEAILEQNGYAKWVEEKEYLKCKS